MQALPRQKTWQKMECPSPMGNGKKPWYFPWYLKNDVHFYALNTNCYDVSYIASPP